MNRTLVALTCVALTAGCTSTKESTVTKDEAVARVAANAQEAFQHLPPGATLQQTRHTTDIPCDDNAESTFVETGYQVVFDDAWPVDESMAAIADYWTANGYTIVRDDRDSKDLPELVVERKTDGFRVGYLITFVSGGDPQASLLSSSPCIRP